MNKGTADSMRRSINDEIAYEVSPKGVYMRAHRWKPHSVSKSKEHGRMYHGNHIPRLKERSRKNGKVQKTWKNIFSEKSIA